MFTFIWNIINMALWALLLGLAIRWLVRRHRARSLPGRRDETA